MSNQLALNLALPAGSLDSYVQAVNRIPMLTPEEERELARRFRQQNDLDAARQLVLSHLRFVVRVARGYNGYGLGQADLIQEGNIGLMKAVKRFDPELGVRLVSFAVHWVRAEIHEFILRNWRIVKVATTKAQRKLFFNLRSSKKRLGWMNRDEVDAVARDLGVSARDVLEMEQRLSGHDASFDLPANLDGDDAFVPAAYLEDLRPGPEQQLEHDQEEAGGRDRLQAALGALDARSRVIIEHRWLREDKATLHDLAEQFGVSAERIRQLEGSAMSRMRAALATA
ncbi:MAG: RNA polymerase sigma factor RpoH [Gammaproteobacteria bacterium]|nr:RNA polymerase sigma factor RpoH [Gammaproteobacteria bacterium]